MMPRTKSCTLPIIENQQGQRCPSLREVRIAQPGVEAICQREQREKRRNEARMNGQPERLPAEWYNYPDRRKL
jgi:hypothetical protein